mmetsp:Transcript_3153/g.9002  ORF Transcript_3153/g.9002 Transcript_3153/m.9002 type:complete len:349 (+) Transcript_3153:177-1223(+)
MPRGGAILLSLGLVAGAAAFAPAARSTRARVAPNMALAGFAKKLQQAKVDELKSAVAADAAHPVAKKMAESGQHSPSGIVYTELKKPFGTIAVLAEYKRKVVNSGFLRDGGEVLNGRLLSGNMREAGAGAIAIGMDPNVGGATEEDFADIYSEQESVRGDYPGPRPLIWHDLIIDEVQIAKAAVANAAAVTISWAVNGAERATELAAYAAGLGLESIIQVNSAEDLKAVVDSKPSNLVAYMGCKVEEGVEAGAILPEDRSIVGIVTCDIPNKPSEDLEEVSGSWELRDAGWGCVWASDILYRAGMEESEDCRAIIKAIKNKTSTKFGTPKGVNGKGEGAREYLGYLEM